jgi:hypothetical protein
MEAFRRCSEEVEVAIGNGKINEFGKGYYALGIKLANIDRMKCRMIEKGAQRRS